MSLSCGFSRSNCTTGFHGHKLIASGVQSEPGQNSSPARDDPAGVGSFEQEGHRSLETALSTPRSKCVVVLDAPRVQTSPRSADVIALANSPRQTARMVLDPLPRTSHHASVGPAQSSAVLANIRAVLADTGPEKGWEGLSPGKLHALAFLVYMPVH